MKRERFEKLMSEASVRALTRNEIAELREGVPLSDSATSTGTPAAAPSVSESIRGETGGDGSTSNGEPPQS